MTLGNMREQGLHHLIGFCHNDACRHQALIDVLVRRQGRVRQMRGTRPTHRRAAELERGAGLN
jgi:hypothetical protein